MRPSALGAVELAAWRQMQMDAPFLQRAFLTPTFAQACERANNLSYIAILHENGMIRGFLPFQFRSAWHRRLGMAERIGGSLSDAAGLVAARGLFVASTTLMGLCRLGSLFITHLMAGQAEFGLDAEWSDAGYVTDLRAGPAAFFTAMAAENRDFVRDTERRLRRAERNYGTLLVRREECIPPPTIDNLIEQKREQYYRTKVDDALANPRSRRIVSAMNETPVQECRLVLTQLMAGAKVLAQHLGPQHNDILSYWFPVYDTQARDISPGRLLLWLTIGRAETDGVRLIDRGEGNAPYKRELATGMTVYGRANWTSDTVRALTARAWQSLEWRVGRLHHQSRIRPGPAQRSSTQ